MKVITIYGSKSDLPFMEPAREYLKENNVEHEEVVYSAHRDLPELIEYLKKLEADGTKAVLLCVAGLSAALPGVVVMNTDITTIMQMKYSKALALKQYIPIHMMN